MGTGGNGFDGKAKPLISSVGIHLDAVLFSSIDQEVIPVPQIKGFLIDNGCPQQFFSVLAGRKVNLGFAEVMVMAGTGEAVCVCLFQKGIVSREKIGAR